VEWVRFLKGAGKRRGDREEGGLYIESRGVLLVGWGRNKKRVLE